MAKRTYFIYNPSTLTYERVYPSRAQRLLILLRQLFLGMILGAVLLGLLLYYVIDSPKEKRLKEEQATLLGQYSILSHRLDEALTVQSDIQERDDNLYRVFLQAEPISMAVRSAGISNPNRYQELKQLSDADLVITTSQKMDQLSRQLYIQSSSFDELVHLGRNHEDRLKRIPAIQPVSNRDLKRTASGYGRRLDPIYKTIRQHDGMDFTANIGTHIYATGDGTVIQSGWEKDYGNTVTIDHGYGYRTKYAHMSKIIAKRGKKVTRGEVIGEVGSTGKSTGPHLHYEVHHKGVPVNPINYYYLDLTPEEYDRMIQLAENQGQVMD